MLVKFLPEISLLIFTSENKYKPKISIIELRISEIWQPRIFRDFEKVFDTNVTKKSRKILQTKILTKSFQQTLKTVLIEKHQK